MPVTAGLDIDPEKFGRDVAASALADMASITSRLALVEIREARLKAIPDDASKTLVEAAKRRSIAGWEAGMVEAWYDAALAAYSARMRNSDIQTASV